MELELFNLASASSIELLVVEISSNLDVVGVEVCGRKLGSPGSLLLEYLSGRLGYWHTAVKTQSTY